MEVKEDEKGEEQDESALWFRQNRSQGEASSTAHQVRGDHRVRDMEARFKRNLDRGYSRYQRGGRGRCCYCNSDKFYKFDFDGRDQSDKFTGMERKIAYSFVCYEGDEDTEANIIIDAGATKTVNGEEIFKKATANRDSEEKLMIPEINVRVWGRP